MDMEKHLIIEQQGVLGIISLNRVANLNALSIEMIHQIHMQFETWQQDHSIQAILIKSNSPKAFCAGGDIRYLYDNYKNQTEAHKAYFSAEYDMLNMIRDYQKPVIVILDGYVLGGGFGLAQACHIIVSSEKSRFAMPETAIGFFPDVAATHFLSRLDDIGVYMAITGEQISSSDALYLDLIDYHVPGEKLQALQNELAHSSSLNKEKIQQMVRKYITRPAESDLSSRSENIRKHFGFKNLQDIEQSLENEQDEQYKAWTNKILITLQQRSLIAKQASLKLQHLGRSLSLQQCMQIERDLQDIWFEHGDFIEGVRALIVDKDKQPQWKKENPELEQILERLG
ncbi:enoyl-CoA hydratase/isomerase family protein [Acinetobacter radioresistens]|uniref:enoyl-CoA hydratase/isomerase family protein n=1 Tax=Acinetobacter radioresistens TaxID=40216 RepID=UPI0020058138|nr:enoyl-CoA hydratase/isomerase family protein [Acinetobacter radioresistens]MCK4090497.1 enoyl-CoA hydratase/isomerase family protein [Acinetobacter radioresistens]